MKSCRKYFQTEKLKHLHLIKHEMKIIKRRLFLRSTTRHEVNIKYLLRVWFPAATRPDPFHNLFFLPDFSNSKHFWLLLINKPSDWTDRCGLASSARAVFGWSSRQSRVSTCALSLLLLGLISVPPFSQETATFRRSRQAGPGTSPPARTPMWEDFLISGLSALLLSFGLLV